MNDPAASPPMANHTTSITASPTRPPAIKRNVRRLVLAVGHRQEMREVARPRQRVDLPAVGEDDGVEACHQPGDGDQGARASPSLDAENRAEAVEDRLARGAEREGAVHRGGAPLASVTWRSIGIAGLNR